jgi:hypothetical protein
MLIYQGLNRPLIERLKNNIELVNEFCITNVSIQMLYFSDWCDDPQAKYMYGWHMCAMIAFNIAFNLYYVFYYGGRGIYLVFIKYKNRISHYFNKKNKEINHSDISESEDSIVPEKKEKYIHQHVLAFKMEDA